MDYMPFVIAAGSLQVSALFIAAGWGISMEAGDKMLGAACAIVAVLMTAGAYGVFWWGVGR
jgi:hypothetical protein